MARLAAAVAATASLIYLAAFLYSVLAILPSSAGAANTAPGSSYTTYTVAGTDDWFRTWDFASTTIASNNVDWPMRYAFTESASINYLKNRLDGYGNDPSISPQLTSGGSTKYAYIEDNDPWFYPPIDGDGGKKQGIDSCSSGTWDWGHMRFYANNFTDYNYNDTWSFYVIASSHKDYEGSGCTHQFLSTEDSEDSWSARFSVLAGSHGWSYSDFYNYFGNGGYSCASGTTNIKTGGGTPYHWYCGDGYPIRVWVY